MTTGQPGLRACSYGCYDAGRPLHPAPQPIERCPCAESLRYRAALDRILTVLDVEEEDADDLDTAVEAIVVVMVIARRALALEPEGKK